MKNSGKNPQIVDYANESVIPEVLREPPLLISSHKAGWKQIQLANLELPAGGIPEIIGL
jgi:hypothetical protein